jgi:hypothetical protein
MNMANTYSAQTRATGPEPEKARDARHARASEADLAEAARDRRMLDRLAEIGMEIAEALGEQVLAQAAAPDAPVPGPDLTLAFTRVARTVRQTLALKPKLAEEWRVLEENHRRRDVGFADRRRKRVEVERSLVKAIAADTRGDAERLRADLHERLGDADIDDELGKREVGAIIAGICRDLGLDPEPGFWQDEPWYVEPEPAFDADDEDEPAEASPPQRLPPACVGWGYEPWNPERRRDPELGPLPVYVPDPRPG